MTWQIHTHLTISTIGDGFDPLVLGLAPKKQS
jgi:hypothetical protein